ncbi:hypothetical protein ACWDCZ_39290, partial [Kitasatospora sp. NPDC001225]
MAVDQASKQRLPERGGEAVQGTEGPGQGERAELISDAAHMLTDAASIVLALIAMRLAARPARGG